LNVLDIVLLVVLAGAAFQGLKSGLIGAAVNSASLIIGWMLAGQLSDEVGALFASSIGNDTIVTVISYVVIMALSLVVGKAAWKILKPIVGLATLGLVGTVDRVGGVALGLVTGFVVIGAIVIVLARFTYNFELPDEGIAGTVADRIPRVQSTRDSVEGLLMESAIVPTFVNVADALPASALGFVPSDFRAAFDILNSRIDMQP
jgi:uncharacterized membrane protein required for colicin V production